MRLILAFLLLLILPANAADAPTAPAKYQSLHFGKVNMRSGPGQQYPITWIYQRKWLPVEILASYDVWRKIADPEGMIGWVQETMLSDRRTVMVKAKQSTLRHDPADAAQPVATVEPGAIARVQSCATGWCDAKFDGYEGWIKQGDLWGTLAGESFDTRH